MPRVKIDDSWYPLSIKGGVPEWLPRSIQVFPPQVSQEDMAEAQLPADKRPAVTIRDVSEGFGLPEQPLDGPIRGFDRVGDTTTGEGIDASLTPNGPILLGPALWTFISGGEASNNKVRMLQYGTQAGRVFYGDDVYTLPAWVATDIGTLGGAIGGQPVAFRGTQTAEHWFAPLGAGVTPQYSTDQGANWANVTTSGGLTEALDMAVADGEVGFLYTGKYGTAFRRFQDGGVNPTVYGTIDPVTTQASAASRLLNWQDRFVIISDQEVLLLARDKSELVQNLLPEVTFSGDIIYPDGCATWRGLLIIPTSRGCYAISPGGGFVDIGPDGDGITGQGGMGGISASGKGGSGSIGHKGVIQAVAGDAYNLYAVFALNTAAVTGRTAWLMKGNISVNGGSVSSAAWFPIVNLGVINTCRGMCIVRHNTSDFIGFPTKSLLFSVENVGLSVDSENLYLVRLPNYGRDPRADSFYRYALNGTFYPSRLNARFMAFSKDWLSVLPRTGDLAYGVDGQTSVTGLGLQARYKADSVPLTGTAPYGYSTTTTQGSTEATGVRVDLSGVRARGLDLAIRFSTAHASSQHSPQLYAVTTDYRTAPDSIWQHSLVLDISSGAYKDDGSGGYGDPLPPDAAYRKLRTLPNKAPFEFVDPMGNTVTCFVPSGGIQIAPQGMPEEGYGDNALPLKIPIFLVETVPAAESIR